MARSFLSALLASCWLLTTYAAAPTPVSVLEAAQGVVIDAVESIPIPPPEPARTEPLADCTAAIDLVVEFEISSRGYYNARLVHPIWPGAASGVTIGVGYDLGHQIPTVIRLDWQAHPQSGDLPPAAGVTGERARPLTRAMQHVQTPLRLAEDVFTASTVPRYWRSTARAFPGIEGLRPCAQGALFSLVYNRGSAMAGSTRTEMRAIRDQCVPLRDHQCIADQIRRMDRLWRGTSIEAGMTRRRNAEADLALQ